MLGQLNKILVISDSETGLKVEKSGSVFGEESECGDDDVELLVRERKFRYFVSEERSKAVSESTG